MYGCSCGKTSETEMRRSLGHMMPSEAALGTKIPETSMGIVLHEYWVWGFFPVANGENLVTERNKTGWRS